MISQDIFAKAAKAKNAAKLLTHLAAFPVNQELADELATLVRHCSALIHSRPNPAGQAARDKLLADVRDFLERAAPALSFEPYDKAAALLQIAEDGHHRILAALQRTAFSKEPAPSRAAAVIARAEANRIALAADLDAALKAAGHLILPGGPEVKDADGNRVDADSFLGMLLEALRGTLLMEGYANKWFSGDRQWLTLPSLPAVSDREIYLAEQAEFLAMAWARWERLHEKARYFGVEINTLGSDQLPDGAPEGVKRVYERAAGGMVADFIANERAIDREGKSAADLFGTTNIGRIGKGIDNPVQLPPTEWISEQEALNSLSLSEAVGYNIAEDLERPGGLRLVQWVRGYMALAAWVSKQRGDQQKLILEIDPAEARVLLQRMSFTQDEADIFLDAVSFGAGSRDFFDAPIVRTRGNWLVIGGALFAPRMAKIVPSTLASMDVQLLRKGSAFESRVVDLFKLRGLDARRVKVKRDGAEYDYDVVVPWGDYLFHFECKNHGLSGNDPKRAYHFLQEVGSSIRQIQRLRDGLVTWPDILTIEFGPQVTTKTVVHCLLHNETFSFPEGIDGVYIYDWSALTRFFEAAWFRVVHDHRGPQNTVFRNRVGVKRIWSGEEPTPTDLLEELTNPSQYRIVLHHVREDKIAFELDAETFAIESFYSRAPGDTASYAEALGVSGKEIEEQLERVDEQIKAAIAHAKASEK
ncbi:hypothetical protein ACFYE9_32455 [Rhizobium leguminosarum]|uniref:NERD domain-containing protein n=2 Tax=Rhizobium leguminosarum TaxID=384 RepID=A0A154IHI3_RHILE|nr:hypothetical protein [Rhizobium leguminosarum]KZA99885.1 hypothetical protein A4A59_20910 [Rhizobium leguminosarum]